MSPGPSSWPRVDVAHLVGTLLETLLLPVYLMLLKEAMKKSHERYKSMGDLARAPLFCTAIVMLAVILGNWITGVIGVFRAFVLDRNTMYTFGPGTGQAWPPSVLHFLKLNDPVYLANTAFYVAGTFLGDAFMAYRLYIVYLRNWGIVALPALMCAILLATGGVVIWRFSQLGSTEFTTAKTWVTTSFALTFVCNLYSTGLIAFRLYASHRQLSRIRTTPPGTNKVANVLVQSAALYSLLLIISLITYLAGSNIVFITVAVTNPTIGIIFCMIVTRVQKLKLSMKRPPFWLFDNDTEKMSAGAPAGTYRPHPAHPTTPAAAAGSAVAVADPGRVGSDAASALDPARAAAMLKMRHSAVSPVDRCLIGLREDVVGVHGAPDAGGVDAVDERGVRISVNVESDVSTDSGVVGADRSRGDVEEGGVETKRRSAPGRISTS